jgi:CHASE1-domain containing sensor protein
MVDMVGERDRKQRADRARGGWREEEPTIAELTRSAEHAGRAIRAALVPALELAHTLPARFASDGDGVTRDEFRVFVREVLARNRTVYALEWVPVVPSAERNAFEDRARREGLAAFGFTELGEGGRLVTAAERPTHLPIYYMEPPSASALGFDLTTAPDLRAPMERARDTGEVSGTGRLRLLEDPASVASIGFFAPVYRASEGGGRQPGTTEARRQSLAGYAGVVVRLAPMLDAAMVELTTVELALFDKTGGTLLFESAAGTATASDVARVDLRVADRTWQAVVRPRAGVAPADRSWGALGAGLLLTAVLTTTLLGLGYIRSLRRQVSDARRLGQYDLERKLGQGGMGTVYRARHALLRRPTAIKLLPMEKVGAQAIARFEREVQHTSSLTHPNTVSIYDYGRTPDGVFYYAMEYLDGVDLQDLVDQTGPQDPRRVVHVLKQVAGALSEAHPQGLVHRDVKPANIVLCERGGVRDTVKVFDFGLVKDITSTDVSQSTAATIIGTPLYMAPEAVTAPEAVGPSADLYALGAVAYFLLTGVPPFHGQSVVEVCSQHVHQAPVPPSVKLGRSVPPSSSASCSRAWPRSPTRVRPRRARWPPSSRGSSSSPAWAGGRAPWPKSGGRCEAPRSRSEAPISAGGDEALRRGDDGR